MSKFYVIHYTEKNRLKKLTPEQTATVVKKFTEALAKNPAVKYNGTMFDPNTMIGVCDFDAPTAKDVEGIQKAIGVAYDVVIPVEPLK